jgi:predicted Fe-S protein YdhL (DUF1289 family)
MQNDICIGCLRTLDEIARWGNAGDAEKKHILAAVAQRRQSPSAGLTDLRGE